MKDEFSTQLKSIQELIVIAREIKDALYEKISSARALAAQMNVSDMSVSELLSFQEAREFPKLLFAYVFLERNIKHGESLVLLVREKFSDGAMLIARSMFEGIVYFRATWEFSLTSKWWRFSICEDYTD